MPDTYQYALTEEERGLLLSALCFARRARAAWSGKNLEEFRELEEKLLAAEPVKTKDESMDADISQLEKTLEAFRFWNSERAKSLKGYVVPNLEIHLGPVFDTAPLNAVYANGRIFKQSPTVRHCLYLANKFLERTMEETEALDSIPVARLSFREVMDLLGFGLEQMRNWCALPGFPGNIPHGFRRDELEIFFQKFGVKLPEAVPAARPAEPVKTKGEVRP